jgi:hypothetical protein
MFVHIPTSPLPNQLPHKWLTQIANITKTAKNNARKITIQYTKTQIQKGITEYRKLYNISPKKINQRVFRNTENTPLDSLLDRNQNILTNLGDIAKEI